MNEKFMPEINAGSPERSREEMERRLQHLQVLFCDQLYQKYKLECEESGRPNDKVFSDFLEEKGAQYAGEFRKLAILSSDEKLDETEQYELVKKYYQEIDKLYNELPDRNTENITTDHIQGRLDELRPLIGYLNEAVRNIKEKFPDKWREMHEPEDEKEAGLIAFNFLDEYDTPEIRRIKTALVEEAGFSKNDRFLEIHWPAQFGDQKINEKTMAESFKILARIIVDEYPETQAVVTASWLLDHHKYKDIFGMKVIGEGDLNWGQMIGSDRQVRQDRVGELLQTEKMPYRNLIGYISTEELLKKYLC
jgi:hypothetical protein